MKQKYFPVALSFALLFAASSAALAKKADFQVEQSVLVKKDAKGSRQLFFINLPANFEKKFVVQAEAGKEKTERSFEFEKAPAGVSILVPSCEKDKCLVTVRILDKHGKLLGEQEAEQAPVRPWKIYMVPFTHIDIGFTQSQKNVLKQNIENLRTELKLIEETNSFPENSRFKLFTEVSWAVDEFLSSPDTSDAEKTELKNAISAKRIEPGAFLISHQNKFMPAEAIYASILPGLKIAEQTNTQLKTACIHDVFDFSNVAKPLSGASVKYLMVGPNDSRYAVPPLFYLLPPVGGEKILVWHATGLNGYGENFDLKMKLKLPIQDSDFEEMEKMVSQHLKRLEYGYPTKNLAEYYDYFGASWPYPYDAFLLPYYPAQGGDNQAQNIVPCEIAKKWNEEWASPQIIISTPQEFFEYAEKNFQAQIPEIRGEMAGFWGEQIFLDLIQVDPQKEAKQRKFEVNAINAGAALTDRFLAGKTIFNPVPELWPGYKRLILNNDHNPRPVPFGGTNYTKENVQEWKDTRVTWIQEMETIGNSVLEKACAGYCAKAPKDISLAPAKASREAKGFMLENKFYRVTVDSETGGIKSILDKELGKELVNQNSKYGLNQYLVAVRGENAGLRNYLKIQPGFKSVKIEIDDTDRAKVSLVITGERGRGVDASQALAKFVKQALGAPVPASIIKAAARLFFIKNGKPVMLRQQIILSASEKKIEFMQTFSGNKPQWSEHIFAYPLNVAAAPLEYDAGYSLLSFTPGPPLGSGDIIPGAKNIKAFPSINFSLAPFQWMFGTPPDFTFNNYVMTRGQGFAIAFSSVESKAIIPGPVEHDPEKGPLTGEFYQVGLGFTLWGKAGLGADLDHDVIIHSALTSFPASTPQEAREKAFRFGRDLNGDLAPARIRLEPSSVAVVASWPENDSALVVRFWETSGKNADATIKLDTGRKIKAAYLARSDGKAISFINSSENNFSLPIPADEVRTIRIELLPQQ